MPDDKMSNLTTTSDVLHHVPLSARGDGFPAEVLAASLEYAKRAWSIFPCVYLTKEPAVQRGFYSATSNPETIRRWLGGGFRRNLAVRTGLASGVWVLDVDDPDALTALEDHHGALPTTLRSQSSRGTHLWFKCTSPIPSSSGRVAPGIDCKGEGGYIVVPPSVHPTGVVYRWLNDEPIADAPEWLVRLARKPAPSPSTPKTHHRAPGAYGAAALKVEIDALANAPRGSRNHALNRASFALHQLVAGGELDASDVEQRLIEAATANGLLAEDGPRQVMATIRSGARAGLKLPRSRNGGR
jgi:Bifunctional DNA primase/polymerase, N-terminal